MSIGSVDPRGTCSSHLSSGSFSPASPVPRIKWRKVDGSLSPQWGTAEPTLQIPSVSFEDEGTYECEAENSKGRDTVQGRIIVQGTELETTLSSPRKQRENPRDWEAFCLLTLARTAKHSWRGHLRAQQGHTESTQVFQKI